MSKVLTTCGYCSCGCGLYVEGQGRQVTGLCPSVNHPVSGGRLCIKGWNATPSVLGAGRLTTPLLRKNGRLEPASWREAISFTASSVRRLLTDSGPQSLGVIGSAKTTNEECYSLVKLARGVIGTPNIDGACRFYDAAIIPGLLQTTGVAASQADLSSIPQAGSMLIAGSNVMDQLAHVGSRIQDAARNGCRIVVVDPRASRLAPQATLFLHSRPGTDLAWTRALVREIIRRKLFVDSAPEMPGFEELCASLDDAIAVKPACGIGPDEIAEAAKILAGDPPAVVMFGLGVLQQADATAIVKMLANVALLLGASVMPLRGQNNAQGSCDLGLVHDRLPGYMPLADEASRKVWESAWDCELPLEPGMSAVDMLRACGSGDLKGLMVFGENVALSAPNSTESVSGLDKLSFLSVSDLYLTETADLADVVFPACSFLEKDGTFTSVERRVQRVRKVVEPIGESKSDLEIVADLASALGNQMAREPADVMAEISAHVPQYAGVSYEMLDQSWGHQWPLDGIRARLAAVPAPRIAEDDEYPFRLIASRINYHQQTGTMAARSSVLAREYPEAFVELNEADAEKLGLRPGRRIRISSKSASLDRVLALSSNVPVGSVHVPHFFGGDSANVLVSYECDLDSGVPAFKGCAVKVEAIA